GIEVKMTSDGGCGSGRGGGSPRQALKKGPWTAAEDVILTDYVRRHGEGNWNAVQRNSGLMRCGKSCRLRWANHLRPNLKKGAFTIKEERLILQIHSKIGNKWARMASQLPGRTDNEIKNYWNTRLKRRQRAGLPIYPQEIKQQAHQQQKQLQTQPNSSSSSLSSLLSSSSSPASQQHKPNYNVPSASLFNSFTFPSTASNLQPSSNYLSNIQNHFKLMRSSNGGLALSLSTPSSSRTLFNQGLQLNSPNFNINPMLYNTVGGFVQRAELAELPLSQPPILPETTPTSSGTSTRSFDANEYEVEPEFLRRNSGLLEDLFQESQALTQSEKSQKEILVAEDKGKGENWFEYGTAMEDADVVGHGDAGRQNHWEDSGCIGLQHKNDVLEEMNIMDDDLLSLLDFPLTGPVPDWYGGSGNTSPCKQPSNLLDENLRTDGRGEASSSPTTIGSAMVDHDWTLGSCCWDNLPTIY
ncbi:hypothetical protein RJ639_035269, partial [Escallonia herrerae]